MAEKTSLLGYLEHLEKDYNKQRMQLEIPGIVRHNDKYIGLELAVADSYEKLKGDIVGINPGGVFDVYLEAEDISKGLLEEYNGLVGKLKEVPYKLKDDGILRKIANKTSLGFFHEHWGEYGRHDESDLLHSLFGIPTLIPPVIAVSLLGTPWGIPAVALLWGSLFVYPTKLNGKDYKFKKDAKYFIENIYRLNYLSRKMEKEVADIESLDEIQVENFVNKYSIEGIRKKMLLAQNNVKNVINLTEEILKAVNVNPPKLGEYIPSSLERNSVLQEIENSQNRALPQKQTT